VTTLSELERALGPAVVFGPGSDEYAAATRPGNASFAQHPAAVLRPRSAQDVAEAVGAAPDFGLAIIVQATGHGSGSAITDDTLLVDMSQLAAVSVDSGSATARVGGGAVWSSVQQAAEAHGLLGLSGTSPAVGVAGYTFGGGVGWLVRPFGLAASSLRSVEYVDGRGRIRRAAEDAFDLLDRDALWAFRGGGAVAIATELEFAVHPVPDLCAGYLMWPAERLAGLAAAWSGSVAASSGVTSTLMLLHLPPQGPFPPNLLGRPAVHLSYASVDGPTALEGIREAMINVAASVIDTTAAADAATLSTIHLDPPVAVPARGTGRWLSSADADTAIDIFNSAQIGEAGGLTMVEIRHVATNALSSEGAMTHPPAPFLLDTVGQAPDDNARARIDNLLSRVEEAAAAVDLGLSVPSFRGGQPDPGQAHPPATLARLRQIATALDPNHLFRFQRSPAAVLQR
jgi:FAD/FMN-containing dehydrogenase